MRAPKPAARPGKASLLRHLSLFRKDILSAQPEHLYAAKMAEFRTPFFHSVMVNDADLVRTILLERPDDFPKSARWAEGLRPLLGRSVFVSRDAMWRRQRRILTPAFDGGRLRDNFAPICAAARAMSDRLSAGIHDIEPVMSRVAADVIFRCLFSRPIDDDAALRVFDAFRSHQRSQPLVNLGAFFALPQWMPRLHRRRTLRSAREIRRLLADIISRRAEEIRAGTAPDDLATRIMTTPDPESGEVFTPAEMADQVAIFFLAGHETSASTMSWAMYLLACDRSVQARSRQEARAFIDAPGLDALSGLTTLRGVVRETLRLYPPVPMLVRETLKPECLRDRALPAGCQVVVSPWHMHRNPRYWSDPDDFCPDRWSPDRQRPAPDVFLPFSAGPRVCPGAGFAMTEILVVLCAVLARFDIAALPEAAPVPVAHLTVRSRDGIRLRLAEL